MVVLESQPLFQKNQFPLMLYQQPLSHFSLERLNIHNRGFSNLLLHQQSTLKNHILLFLLVL